MGLGQVSTVPWAVYQRQWVLSLFSSKYLATLHKESLFWLG